MGEKQQDINLLVKISKLYYEQGLTQQRIAEREGFSRMKIINILEEARQRGIVQIRVLNPNENYSQIRQELRRKFGFLDIQIIPSYSDPEFLRKELAHRACEMILQLIKPYYVIGVGWGAATMEIAQSMPERMTDMYLEWVPLAGGLGMIGQNFQTNDTVSVLQRKLGGSWHPFNVPAIVDNGLIRNAILSDSSISQVVNKWNHLDMAVFGIGAVESSLVSRVVQFTAEKEHDTMEEKTYAVGEVVCNCFDKDGSPCEISADSQRLGIPYHCLMKTPIRIGVAAEKVKQNAILACARSGLVNCLVTDEECAKFLLSQPR